MWLLSRDEGLSSMTSCQRQWQRKEPLLKAAGTGSGA